MSHRFRKWLKDLLQYGRRGVQASGDEKPPLLWLADLPRLASMWSGHLWFRTWLDLRSMPPRVIYDPREVFSRHVAFARPVRLSPIRPLQSTREALAAFQKWLAEGGLEKAVARLGGSFAGGVAGVFGAIGAGIAGVFGASAIGAALGLNALGEGVRDAARRSAVGAAHLRDGLAGGIADLAGRFQNPRDVAWTFATVTGTAGLILLMVLQSSGLTAAPRQVAATEHVVQRPPAPEVEPEIEEPVPQPEDPFGVYPDPFGGPESAPEQSEPPADPDWEDPFGPIAEPEPPVEPEPVPVAEVEAEIERAELPPEIARFNLPDDEELFLVEAGPGVTPVDPAALPADDWSLAAPERTAGPGAIVPAAYRESREPAPAAVESPRPAESGDRFTPAVRSVAVTVTKTQPAEAKSGELLWYDLVVTNRTGESIPGVVVEEHVAEPHRVADASPAASFDGGTLTWRLGELRPGEERRLGVAVYPMSEGPIVTTAAVRPLSTFSTVTLVQAEEPAEVEQPPVVRPEPEPQPEPTPEPEPEPEPLRRVRIVMTTPERVTAGADCVVRFAVTNTGDAPLTGVAVRGILPSRLRHPNGSEIESGFGSLGPGQTETAEMRLTAGDLGEAELMAEVSAAEGVATTVRGSFAVVESLPASRPAAAPAACCCPVGMLESR